VPLLSKLTAEELTRVLTYPQFRLQPGDRHELLAEYIPFCELVEPAEPSPLQCRDKNDQSFLDLAHSGKADLLVTGDRDLLDLAGQAVFLIETPEAYRRRISPHDKIKVNLQNQTTRNWFSYK
jgi:putative PIN family toxin of toxin-antitoxin system